MRFLLIVAAYAALTVSCFAQTPQELTGSSTIRLHPGESKLMTSKQPFAKFHLTDEGVAQVSADTDQQFVLKGLKPGTVLMSIYRADGILIERANVVVAGGLVRIYGTSTADEKKGDYIGYICSESGCGRADPEVERPEAQTTVTRTRRNSRGDIITTTTPR
jgi:hypothetical protein